MADLGVKAPIISMVAGPAYKEYVDKTVAPGLYSQRTGKALMRYTVYLEREPKVEPYGTVAVFKDLYGNLWDLVERKA